MPAFLSGVKPAIKNLLNSHKTLDAWIDNVTADETLDALTKVYTEGDVEENITPALTAEELAAFKKNFAALDAEPQTSIQEIGAFYAGYPFAAETLPLSQDGFLRAVVALTGKDKALYEKSAVTHEGAERIIRKGRNEDDRVRLLFSAMAGGHPTRDDVLDVLSLVQPRPDTTKLPKGHRELTSAATRLAPAPVTVSALPALPAEEVATFFRGIGLDAPVIAGPVNFEEFKKIIAEKPETFDALSKKASAYLQV